ncbi:hypothetical protein ACFL96_08610 [Thermoproteota archaeon]
MCCKKLHAAIILILGILLLIRDLGYWDIWNIQPWTLAFLLVGIAVLHKDSCKIGKKKK